MTRVQKQARTAVWFAVRGRIKDALSRTPRIGYCDCCGTWGWNTKETAAYSSAIEACRLCEECADDNDKETEAAWADYYLGRL